MSSSQGNAPERVLVFIPSFGDAVALPRLQKAIAALGPRYWTLIVDDGSADPLVRPTGDRCLLVRLPANFGLGVSLDIAFAHVLGHDYGVLVRIDADGQHAVHDIPTMVAAIEGGDADLAVGVRVNQGEPEMRGSIARRVLKAYFRFLARVVTRGAAPADVNSGFFAVRREAISVLRRTRFERFPEPELYVAACVANLKVTSVAVNQQVREDGRSTLDLIAAARMLFRFNIYAVGHLLRRIRR